MPWPDRFDLDDVRVALADLPQDADTPESDGALAPRSVGRDVARLCAARREVRWFYVRLRGRVPAVGEALPEEVAAASTICGWLSALEPSHRGAFVLRYDTRRWPVRLIKQFGGLTSTVVRFAAIRLPRGPSETLAEVEGRVVEKLLADIAAARRRPDATHCPVLTPGPEVAMRRLRRAALDYVRTAERAYAGARGDAACVVDGSWRGA